MSASIMHVARPVVEGERGVAVVGDAGDVGDAADVLQRRARGRARGRAASRRRAAAARLRRRAAMSATRKSATVTAPVRAAITAGSPSCSVEADAAHATAAGATPSARGCRRDRSARSPATARAASAKSAPTMKLPWQSAAASPVKSEWIDSRCAAVYGVVRKSTSDTRASRAEAFDVDERGVDAVERGARHEADHPLAAACRAGDERMLDALAPSRHGRCARIMSHSSRTAPSPPGRRVT